MPTCITFFLHATCNDNTTSGTHMSRQIKPLLAVPDQPVRRVHHMAGVGWMQPHGEECMRVQVRGGAAYVVTWLGVCWLAGSVRGRRAAGACPAGTGRGL